MSDLTRRDLLRASGLGAAMLAAAPAFATNPTPLTLDRERVRQLHTDVLVIGGGMAGVCAALAARASGQRVTLVDKGCLGRSGFSAWARRMTALIAPEGSREMLLERIVRDSDGLHDPRWLAQLLDNQARVIALIKARGWLGATPRRRAESWQCQLAEAGVETIERTMLTALLRRFDGRVSGAVGFEYDDSGDPATVRVISSKLVISCMGSGGSRAQGFFGWGQTHDGSALAYRAGASIAGKEFTDLDHAYCISPPPADGRPDAEPRLVLDQLAPPPHAADSPRHRKVGRMLAEPSLADDQTAEPAPPIPVPGMGVFGSEGVIASDEGGEALGIPGLYAAGGGLASMLTGACYPYQGLALMAAAVQGDVIGTVAGRAAAAMAGSAPDRRQLAAQISHLWAPRERAEGYDPKWLMQVLQHQITPFFVSYWKHADRLQAALDQVVYLKERCVPHMIAGDGHALRLAHEFDNLLLDQEMRLRAGLFRTESRGTHLREDYPARNDSDWRCLVAISQSETGEMKLAALPVTN